MKTFYYKSFILLVVFFAAIGLCACATEKSNANWHPVEVKAPALCSTCHTDGRAAALDHTPDYNGRHKFGAAQQKEMCSICHKDSFCADCHAHKEEVKPSNKFMDSTDRTLPHPGDYITRHKIDGRINPAECFKCHGRNNNRRCRTCHR